MSKFHWPTLSDKEPVVPAFASVCSWAVGIFTSCRVDLAHGFVATRCAVLFVANAMDVGGEEPTLDPLSFGGCLQSRDAAVQGFFLCGRDGVTDDAVATAVAAAANDAVALSSSRGKGGFNLCEEFLDLVLLTGGGPGELVESPLENLVSMLGGGCQVVKMDVKIFGEVRALWESAGFSAEQGRAVSRVDAMNELGGGCRTKIILPPC